MEHSMIAKFATTQANLVGLNETLLTQTARQGDLEAFNQLVLLYQDRIYSLALRMLGDEDSAQDITQTTFLNAFLGLQGLRNGSFHSWLYRIATNSCYDELRRRRRHPNLSLESEETAEERALPPSDLASPSILPEKEYDRHELEQTVRQALNRLSAGYQAAVVLVDLEDYSYEEAGKILGISIGTVKSRLARGRVHLSRILNNFQPAGRSVYS